MLYASARGFRIEFGNGHGLSVVFHPLVACELRGHDEGPAPVEMRVSRDAEIAVFVDGEIDHATVTGGVGPEAVAKLAAMVAGMAPDQGVPMARFARILSGEE